MAMRAGWIWGAALAAGCSFKGLGDSDGAPIDSPVSIIADAGADAAGVIGWTLRTRAEFDDPGADNGALSHKQTAASSHDVLEPVAYQILGLLGHAANTQL